MRIGLLLQSAVLSSLALLSRADDCTDGLHNNYVMGEGVFVGQQFADSDKPHYCETRWKDGLTVNGIEVWSSKYNVQAFRLRYSDGSWSKKHGNQNPDSWSHEQITWDSKETVGSIKHRPNKVRDSPGQFEWTIVGKDMVPFGSSRKWGDWIDADVSSGVFLGVWGKGDGKFLSSMMLLFLKTTVEGAEIVEMKFDKSMQNMQKRSDAIQEIFLSRVAIENTNTDGTNKTYTFTNGATRTETQTVSWQTTHTISGGTTVTVGGSVGLPLLASGTASASVSAGFEISREDGESTARARTYTMTWSEAVTGNLLAPGSAAICNATAWQGTLSSDFTSIVKASLADGSSFTYKQRGHFESIGFADGYSNCRIVPIDEVPAEYEPEEAPSKPEPPKHKLALARRFMSEAISSPRWSR